MSQHHKKQGAKKGQRGHKGQLWMLLFNKEKYGKCCWCQKPLLFDDATVEHVIPLSEGGSDKISSGNLNIACLECNNGRARNTQVIIRVEEMGKKIYAMCKNRKEVTPRWKTLVDVLKLDRHLTVEKCKQAYLTKKGVEE